MGAVMKTFHMCGLTRDDANELYAESAQLVYGNVEGGEATANTEATPPRRGTPARRAKTATPSRKRVETNNEPSPKKTRGEEGGPLIKQTHGLLVKRIPTDKRICVNKRLGLKVICCKCAFSSSSTCTLAYCESCMDLMLRSEENSQGGGGGGGGGRPKTRHGGGGGREDRVIGTVVKCCDKGECGKHTEADLEDLETHMIDKSYLKVTREGKQEVGWENVADCCWGCGGLFSVA